MYSIRGNSRIQITPMVDSDPTWTTTDRARAHTVSARLLAKGVGVNEIDSLVRCIIWKQKLPGLIYDTQTEERVASLMLGT
jgi:hypothetical protein